MLTGREIAEITRLKNKELYYEKKEEYINKDLKDEFLNTYDERKNKTLLQLSLINGDVEISLDLLRSGAKIRPELVDGSELAVILGNTLHRYCDVDNENREQNFEMIMEMIELIMEQGIDLNAYCKTKNTSIFGTACCLYVVAGKLDKDKVILKYLLQFNPELDNVTWGYENKTLREHVNSFGLSDEDIKQIVDGAKSDSGNDRKKWYTKIFKI